MHSQLPRSNSTVELTSTGTAKISSEVIAWFVRAIQNKEYPTFVENIQLYPGLLNYPLTPLKQTALMIAIASDANVITQFLLRVGADRTLRDLQNNNAMNYATFKANHLLAKQLTIPDVFPPIYRQLRNTILQAFNQRNHNSRMREILKLTLAQLDKYDYATIMYYTTARQFDLFYTAKSIVHAVSLAHDDASLQSNLRAVLALRENVLRGDDHDYCFNSTLANQLCEAVVQLLWPRAKPLNVLWHNALTQERAAPWRNYQDLSNDLNEPLHEYFRTKDNKIQRYTQTVEKAIASLIRGNSNLGQIWVCLDSKALYTPATIEMINYVQQRSTSLEELVQHTLMLDNGRVGNPLFRGDITIYDRFVGLRQGLMLGDATPRPTALLQDLLNLMNSSGTETEAGSEAYIAIAEFLEWWNSLGTRVIIDEEENLIVREGKLQKQIRQISMTDDDNIYTLNDVLNALWHHRNPATVDAPEEGALFCAQTVGQYLEKMLADDTVKKSLFALEIEKNLHMSNDSLLDLQKQIMVALNSQLTQDFNFGSVFKLMSRFLLQLSTEKLMQLDYSFFSDHLPHLFNARLTSSDINYLNQPSDVRMLELIYDNPKLVLCNPKLSLITAIVFYDRHQPGNAFFVEMEKYYYLKPFSRIALDMLAQVFSARTEVQPPPWISTLCLLSVDYYRQILITLAECGRWQHVWELLDIQIPEPAVMAELLHKALFDPDIRALAHWRYLAGEPQGHVYRDAIIHFWKQAMQQPTLLNQRIACVLNHNSFPEITNIFLQAKTAVEWNCVLIYIKSNNWVECSEQLAVNLCKNALKFDVYVAAALLKSLKPLFCTLAPAHEKPLVLGLADYCEKRLQEKSSSGYFWYSLWGRYQGMHEQIKLSAAIKKILSLRCDSIEFTDKEYQALNNARLGRIVYWNTPGHVSTLSIRPSLN